MSRIGAWTVTASVLLAASAVAMTATQSAAPAGKSSPEAGTRKSGALTQVAAFEHQVTGVTVAKDGRIFVNFPRWSEDAPISVAEVMKDGSIKPYPNAEWNSWRNAKKNAVDPKTHWVCVQSVVVDRQGALWVVDPAAPAAGFLVPGGPKLVKVDLSSNTAVQTISFDDRVAPQETYLNDVRFSRDGRHAYITDSGPRGAIIVVDLQSGGARRLLDGHPSTQVEKDVVVKTDGHELRRPDGRGVEFSSDGIAISADGQMLYWQALTGRTLYRIATSALDDTKLSGKELEGRVERVGENGVSDGLLMDKQGRIYISALEENAIKRREANGQVHTLIADPRLRWPDTFSEGPDGAIYVTASRIQDMPWYKPASSPRLDTTLWRFNPAP